ncbi:Helix-turn-helix domain-containing protein [Paenacidovorax caeni]|uniref:Helix-turn-helix domain-containing protein n=1 Tax=Paenacidovorax caeni TaxID=343013 RepID=A0A1I7J9Y4_9BURK|nr:helix-turn-helix transcriptional regulator [Paenacidovorax caeni]SFU81942.1 Helix-turn-helix domain-containing protein [Paenacidovorax caeni]
MGNVAIGAVTFRTTLMRHDRTVVVEDSQSDPVLARGGMELGQYLAQQERNPAMAAAMAAMRQRMAAGRTACGLATLRQRKGLSQAQLAASLETSQPNIARWEKDPEQMTARSIQRLAVALQVSEQDIHNAMKSTDSARAQVRPHTQVEHADH